MDTFSKINRLRHLVTLIQDSKRFISKINLRKPKKPHFEKARALFLVRPYFQPNIEEEPKPLYETCPKGISAMELDEEENPYQQILANECFELFRKSKIVGFFHLNVMEGEDRSEAYVAFRKNEMRMRIIGRKTLDMALRGTMYEAVLGFYKSQNMIVFSDHDSPMRFLNVTSDFRSLIFLAAIFENRLLNKDEFVKYSRIPNLASAQSNLVHTLNGLGQSLHHNLESHQNNLIQVLDQVKDLKS